MTFEKLIDLGLTTDEATILTTPIEELSKAGVPCWESWDKRNKLVIEKNKSHKWTLTYAPMIISDTIGTRTNTDGVLNPATGKKYDSKSEYYRDTKAAGCEIMGNDAPTESKREMRGNFDCRRELAQAIDQTNFLQPKKGKKK